MPSPVRCLPRRRSSFVALGLALAGAGCATPHMPAAIGTRGIVACCYRPLTAAVTPAPPSAPTLRVADFEHAPPETHTALGWMVTAFVPVVGLVNPPVGTARNALHYPDDSSATGFQTGELERIVADEIRRSGLFSHVEYGGPAADVELRGTIDLHRAIYTHLSGLGFLIGSPWFLWLPLETVDDSCAASFSLVSRDGVPLFERTYAVRARTRIGVANEDDEWANYGRALFPRLVTALLHDLAAERETLARAAGR